MGSSLGRPHWWPGIQRIHLFPWWEWGSPKCLFNVGWSGNQSRGKAAFYLVRVEKLSNTCFSFFNCRTLNTSEKWSHVHSVIPLILFYPLGIRLPLAAVGLRHSLAVVLQMASAMHFAVFLRSQAENAFHLARFLKGCHSPPTLKIKHVLWTSQKHF